jgi:GntR family transcriptional regulator/MocR family aminotransferase
MECRQKCKECGSYIAPVEQHCISKGNHNDKILLGYGHLDSMEIRSGISLLHGLMEEIFRCPTEI